MNRNKCVFIILLMLSSHIMAATLVSNLAGTGAGNATVQNTFWLAQKFTTNADTFEINSFSFIGSRHPATSEVLVYIYDHDAINDVPVTGSTGFGQFDSSSISTIISTQILPAMGTINLSANTSYWIVMQPNNVNGALWGQVTDLGNLMGVGTIDNRRAFSNNTGTSWSGSTPATNLAIELDVTTLPVELINFTID